MFKSKIANQELVCSQSNRTIGFWLLFLMCLNSMSGAGVFVNAKPLALLAGRLSFLAYLIGLAIMLPIVITLTGLAEQKPVAGGLFKYAKDEFGSAVGFLSGWAYFVAKVVSVAVLAQAFTTPFKNIIPGLSFFGSVGIDVAMLSFIVFLNTAGVKLYGKIQFLFSLIKAVPYIAIFFVTVVILALGRTELFLKFGNGINFTAAIPSALFATSGFEIANTMAHCIQEPEKNIRKSVLSAFFAVGFSYLAFQVGAQLICGPELGFAATPFTLIAAKLQLYLGQGGEIVGTFMKMTTLTITFSLMTTNCWNLYAIAKENLLPFSSTLTKVNSKNVPWACLLVEVFLAALIMALSQNLVALQAMSVFATGMSFIFCALAGVVFWSKQESNTLEICISALAVVSCLIILSLSANSILKSGVSMPFLGIFLSGIVLGLFKHAKNKKYYI